ncbi:hypothetical protein TRIUR3_34872 [Triticum urartu]|uniref:Uncharacterized protein n=1 Tax=Triticum urartu TaxID=4572 RepID=M8A951_TRIUA|nr:hypothetical protein TRIUR3_34872 [Triticum urartu]
MTTAQAPTLPPLLAGSQSSSSKNPADHHRELAPSSLPQASSPECLATSSSRRASCVTASLHASIPLARICLCFAPLILGTMPCENDYFHYRRCENDYFHYRHRENVYFLYFAPNKNYPACTLRRQDDHTLEITAISAC